MASDKVAVHGIAILDRSLDIETLSDFFACKIRLREALLHDEKAIALLPESRDRHTCTIVSDALPEDEITEDIVHSECPMIDSEYGCLSGDDTGEHRA